MQEQMNQQETILPYDVVSLPSNGVFYPNKKKSLKVTYLNASDENLLATPSLTSSGTLIDTLLSRKILDKDITVEDMPECDKEAVLIFLRNTAFGSDYNVKVMDKKTKKEFETTLDLSVLKTKDIDVEMDDKNEFTLQLEMSKKTVKLSLLSPSDEKYLREVEKTHKDSPINPYMTKQLERMVKEIDGNRDPMTISQAIQMLPIRDSQSIRKAVRKNTPELNLSVNVMTPSNEEMAVRVSFGVEFFRPFYGI